MKITTKLTIEDLDENFEGPECDVEILWEAGGWYRPARINAPPELCYEAETPDYDVERVTTRAFGRVYDLRIEEVTEFVPWKDLLQQAEWEYERCHD
jgi:hypothetical protein